MAEKKNIYTIYEKDTMGTVKISEEVIAIISALAATEAEGISSIRDGLAEDQISKSGMKALAKSVKIGIENGKVTVSLVLNMKYGYNIKETSKQVQEKVKEVVENMTGLKVVSVNVSIADVDMNSKKAKK